MSALVFIVYIPCSVNDLATFDLSVNVICVAI
jgi:hypothetical protein